MEIGDNIDRYLGIFMGYNAVIEGTFSSGSNDSYFKITRLHIYPYGIKAINDGERIFRLIGKKHYFTEFNEIEPKEGLESKIDGLSMKPGMTTSRTGSILERPRTVFLKDGRVFVAEELLDQEWYMNDFTDFVKEVFIKCFTPRTQLKYRIAALNAFVLPDFLCKY